MVAGNIREKQLKGRILEHISVVKSLAKSPMNGLKSEREEVSSRLCDLSDVQSDKFV